MLLADFHTHSRFSWATSRLGSLESLESYARQKGLQLVGTGDFTHPAWRQELAEKLEPAQPGLYTLAPRFRQPEQILGEGGWPDPLFVVTGEVSCVYRQEGRARKVHCLILLPGLEAAERLSRRLESFGKLSADGRPVLKLSCRQLLAITLDSCPEALLIPAHIWTPHYSMLGAFSQFDSLEQCFGDLAGHIRAVETGLSSDPPMNWRVPALDGLTLVSNSDAHSPDKLGREANLLDIEPSYQALARAICQGQQAGWRGTVEFFPQQGKYHWDGCRDCGQRMPPEQAEALGNRCPVCGEKLTMGVEHRVLQLASRPAGFRPENAAPFQRLAPLPEVIAACTGLRLSSIKVSRAYRRMLALLGPELIILRQTPLEQIDRVAGPWMRLALQRLREGQARCLPGYDGVYGRLQLLTPEDRVPGGSPFELLLTDKQAEK